MGSHVGLADPRHGFLGPAIPRSGCWQLLATAVATERRRTAPHAPGDGVGHSRTKRRRSASGAHAGGGVRASEVPPLSLHRDPVAGCGVERTDSAYSCAATAVAPVTADRITNDAGLVQF